MKLLRLASCVLLLVGVAACDSTKSPTAPSGATPTGGLTVVASHSSGTAGSPGSSGDDSHTTTPPPPSSGGSTEPDDHSNGNGSGEGEGGENDDHGDHKGLTARLRAEPRSIQAGQSSVLRWRTARATSATLDGAMVALNGSMSVSPAVTTTYTLVATNASGSVTSRVTVTVGNTVPNPQPTATLVANPTSLQSGQSSTLTWTSTNATSVTLDGAAVALNGSQSVSPTATHTYSLVASGAGGTATASATVTVGTTTAGLTYTRDVQPILAANCTSCHSASFAAGSVDLSSYTAVLQTLTPGSASSRLVTATQAGGSMRGFLTSGGTAAALAETIRSWVVDSLAAQ
jgi:hypothetical protein